MGLYTMQGAALRPGMGKDDNSMGPEVGFGAIVGEHFEQKVVIIKVSGCAGSTSRIGDILFELQLQMNATCTSPR